MNRPLYRRVAGFSLVLAIMCGIPLAAEEAVGGENSCLIETSAWMVMNLTPDSPDFYQLCLGYELDEKNTLFLNGITWIYRQPLGIPMWDPKFDTPEAAYPGYVRGFGLGLGYQRFLWKGLFASVYAMPFLQNFCTDDDQRIQSGFQLYLQAQLGYQIDLFKGRFFLKPAIYANWWPVNTNMPDSFKEQENNWPAYQSFEAHLNFGFRF